MRNRQLPLAALALVILGDALPSSAQARYDLLFRGGRVVDGTGAPWFAADVAVRDGRIAAIGQLEAASAKRVVDAKGLVIAPGFIDLLGQSEYNVLVDGRAASKITQGITTEVTGEGASIAPINERMFAEGQDAYARYGYTPGFRTLDGYFKEFERRGVSINLGSLVGTGGIRDLVIGKQNRRATPEELGQMCALVDTAMREGALGLSSSLQYVPDIFNSTDEIVAMARVAARHGGAYFTHQRSESGRIDASLDEVFRIASEAGIRSQVWHLKTAYRPNFGRMPEILAKIEALAPAASTSRPTSTPGTAPRTASTRACRRGRAKADARSS